MQENMTKMKHGSTRVRPGNAATTKKFAYCK